ncbi:MAG: hypothetical protein R6U50_13825 [Desulfobacterales bacterium]
MNVVTLETSGSLYCGKSAVEDPLACLGHRVFLTPGYLLRSFFMVFERYPVLKRLNPLFRGRGTEPVWQDSGIEAHSAALSCLELTKTVELVGFPGPPKIDLYVTLQGMQETTPVDIKGYGTAELIDVPIRLGKIKHIVFGDTVDRLECDAVFSLFEILDGILWELGFCAESRTCDIERPTDV